MKPKPASKAQVTMRCEPNQSFSCPLSSMIWRAPMVTASRPRPMPSTLPSVLADALEVGRVFHDAAGENNGENAYGDIEEEDPAPGIVVGNPAADGGPDGGCDDDRHSVDGEGDAAFVGSEGIGEDGALAGLEASAGRALKDAEDDEQSERVGEAAAERKDGEARRHSSCRSACGRCGWRSSR